MSLLNVWVRPDRAVVTVDTACGSVAGAHRFEGSKIAVVPHAQMLLAGRGITSLVPDIALQCHACGPSVETFDLICEEMPTLLRAAHERMVEQGLQLGVQERILFAAHEVACVGWSASRRRIEGTMWQAQPDGTWLSAVLGWACAPGEVLAGREMPDPPPLPELLAHARRQCEHVRANWHLEPIGGPPMAGGRLIVAEMFKGGRISIEAHALD